MAATREIQTQTLPKMLKGDHISMSRITVVIKRNAPYEKSMYGLSVHNKPGGAANVQPITSEQELRERLLKFGFSADDAEGVISRLKERHESVTIDIDESKVD